MALTAAQKATLKTDILANGDATAFYTNGDLTGLAALYNALASPAFIVWRTNIPTSDVKKAVNWTEYIGRSVGERSAFELIISNGIVDASQPNVRAGFNDIFSGQQGVNTRTALLALAKRSCTRGEKVFATGTGSDAVPATLTFEGLIAESDLIGL